MCEGQGVTFRAREFWNFPENPNLDLKYDISHFLKNLSIHFVFFAFFRKKVSHTRGFFAFYREVYLESRFL